LRIGLSENGCALFGPMRQPVGLVPCAHAKLA
jgi:hypothetical protein